MKTLSLRGIDDELSSALKQAAQQANSSINQYVLDRLKQDLGLKKKRCFTKKYHDLDDLFGRWSEEEYNILSRSLEGQRTIDAELWK